MDYEKLCNDIIDLDPLVRFAAIINDKGEKVAGGYRKNISSMLSPDEVKMSMHYAIKRWEARGKLSHRIGEAKYSTTAYEKVKQISIPVTQKELLLMSTDPSANQIEIIEKVLGLLENK